MPQLRYTFANRTVRIEVSPAVVSQIGELLDGCFRDERPSMVALITDDIVRELYASAVLKGLDRSGYSAIEFSFAPGESSKRLEQLAEVYRWLADHHVGRDGLVLALGGGVVSDLAGFAAATWMRGVSFAICPTTLESAIDASIGGKTAVNLPGAKNMIGAFHAPVLVAIDPACLATLGSEDVAAGLAESIKHGLIADPEFVDWHETYADAVLRLDEAALTELIVRNVRIKCAIVERDPFERSGDRMILNFGHTIGHAIEANCGNRLRHGACVGLGMLAACRLSHALGLVPSALVDRVTALLVRFGLPIQLETGLDTGSIFASMRKDKKVRRGSIRFVLLEDVGRPVVRDDVPAERMREAIESLQS